MLKLHTVAYSVNFQGITQLVVLLNFSTNFMDRFIVIKSPSVPCIHNELEISWEATIRLYHIVGNFGEILIWQFGEFGIDHQIANLT